MEIVRSLEELRPGHPSVVTVGVFDGVHIGHQTIMGIVTADAERLHARSVAITFDRNPAELVNPPSFVKNINTLQQKLALIEEQGIELVVVLPLEEKIIGMSGEEFVRCVLHEKLSAVQVVVGTDFAFGKGRSGNVELLESLGPQYGYELIAVSPVRIDDMTVSSTTIRRLIANGQIQMANRLLGHPFVLTGTVVEGEQIGRTLGFPTANVKPAEGQVVPRRGVYAVSLNIDGRELPGVVSIGTRPTFGGEKATIEVHIIGFSGDLYGQELGVAFHHWMRDEERFTDVEALCRQITLDVEQAKSLLK